jgi:sugar lactone lactonase YvrE
MTPPTHLYAQAVADVTCELGESPLWLPDSQELAWLDILGRRLHRFDPGSGLVRSTTLDAEVTAIGLSGNDELIAAVEDGFGWVDPATGRVRRPSWPRPVRHPLGRMNDGAVSPDGAFWSGAKVPSHAASEGGLWRLDPSGAVTEVLESAVISNGLDWFPDDDTRMLYVDSPTGGVDGLQLGDRGVPISRQRVIEIDPASGEPDGLTIDAQGGAWVAIWGAGEVRRYGRSGALETLVHVDARHSSSCCLGGHDGRTLFITSAREGLSEPGEADGRLFTCRVEVPGQPARRFAGRP